MTQEKDPLDARSFRLKITDEAYKLLQVAKASCNSFICHNISGFSADELRLLLTLLQKLDQALHNPLVSQKKCAGKDEDH